ncbi:hypothetical protein PENSPDRAFT_692312 [Peniophora sp. CONT]|nr:hypothetical protein PENSPDRAFT_692312 [Peniophora sp. CONT]
MREPTGQPEARVLPLLAEVEYGGLRKRRQRAYHVSLNETHNLGSEPYRPYSLLRESYVMLPTL